MHLMIHKDAGDKQENGSEGKQWPAHPENYLLMVEKSGGSQQLKWRIEPIFWVGQAPVSL